MTPADFVEALEAELRFRVVSYDRRALQAFVEGAWSLMEEDPDAAFWAREFIAAGNATVTA
jgi:hypothetical protein